MSEGFKIPVETVAKIEALFPESIERRKIAFTLMHWHKKPTTREQETLASAVDRSRNVVYKVINKLMEAGLFTSELGSTPLYRYNERIRLNASKGLESGEITGTDETFKEINGDTEDSDTLEEDLEEEEITEDELPETEIEAPPTEVETPVGPALEKRVALQEAELKELRSTMDSSFFEIKELIGNLSLEDSKEDPNTNPPTVPIEVVESYSSQNGEASESVEALVGRIVVETLNRMQIDNPLNPEVAIADVVDPSMNLDTENPLDDAVDSVIELEGSIISRKTVGFTPKSLMLFDLTRKKGFRGNFADFVNSCISSAMKGRKFKLTVEEDVE